MMEKKREIFIKLDEISNILETMTQIKEKEELLNKLFSEYDNLLVMENKIFDNWSFYLDDINQKLDHVTL